MRVVPRNRAPQIEFFATHVGMWTENAAEIGVAAEQVTQLAEQVAIANAKLEAHRRARSAARDAAIEYRLAVEAMKRTGVSLLGQIRARAGVAGDEIYATAGIPVPQKKSPIGAPGKPYDFTAVLRSEGAITLRWKCDNPRGATGTLYQVQRRTHSADPGEAPGPWTFLGLTGKKKFVDIDIPVGVAGVTYMVQPVRSTRTGEPALHLVSFGVPHNHPARLRRAA